MESNYEWNEVKQINSIKELLEDAKINAGDRIAFEYKNENKEDIKVTYSEFIKDIDALGTALTKYNVYDKHIAIIGENSYKWLVVYLTVLKSAGVFVPIDKELTTDEIINTLNHSESEVLFYSSKFDDVIDEIKDKATNVKFFIGLNEADNIDDKKLSYDKTKEMGAKELEQGNSKYTDLDNNSNNLKMLIYTSGTTGTPKGVMLSEHNLISVANNALRVANIGDKCLSVLPYHHTYEAVAGILTEIHNYSCICINDSIKNVIKNLNFYKPDTIYLVPAFAEVFYKNIWSTAQKTGKDRFLKKMITISNHLRKIGIDLRKLLFKSIHNALGGNLKIIICGGAPLRADIGHFFNDIGIILLNGYGITECSPLVSVNRVKFNDCSTVGVILPCCEVKLENINDEGDGEIFVKGDIVMLGYYKEKEKTERVLKDGWFNTEDYGHLTEKGQLVINGRKKNIIVLDNGKNIYPEEIENYILKINYVKEVIVKAKKNESGQETALIAEVFLNPEKVEEMNETNIKEKLKLDIREVCKDLATYKRASEIEVREEEFVKTTTNKIKR